ncbi:hypothetical protein M2103_002342 [Ereboglobus sp. PH5-5]|nr:hypothetical protein [Ereboglobus sp. PH5-5]
MKTKTSNASAKKKQPTPEFILRAERAFKKVGRQIRAKAKRDGVKPLVWKS